MVKQIFELSFKYRVLLSFLLGFFSLVLQTSGVSFLFWTPVLILAAALIWVKSVKVEEEFSGREREWKEVTLREFKRAFEKARKARKLSTTGFFSRLMVVFIAGFFLLIFIPFLTDSFLEKGVLYLFLDAAVIFLAVFLSGERRIWSPGDLYLKLKTLLIAYNMIKEEAGFVFIPQLLIEKDRKGRMLPVDAKFFVRAQDAPDWLIGLQFQVSINVVQNKKYPYLYSVIILKSGRLSEILNTEKRRGKRVSSTMEALKSLCGNHESKIIMREEANPDVDVVIIRQMTTKTGGYYTDKEAINKIVNYSLDVFKCLVRKNEGQV